MNLLLAHDSDRFRINDIQISLGTRKVLLGHKNGDITSHYSPPEIDELLEAANRVCRSKSGSDFAEKENRLTGER